MNQDESGEPIHSELVAIRKAVEELVTIARGAAEPRGNAEVEILSLHDLAARWKMSYGSVFRLKKKGKLPFLFLIGNTWRANLSDVEDWENLRKIKPSRRPKK